MEDNKIELKTISDLLGMNFFIPSYQRGYRWTELQVEDLLNDIWDFIESDPKKENWYCLQPIVVKNHNDGMDWEVIDGQQRLTTIFLILKHLDRFIESDKKSFCVEYQTRYKSNEFLENITSKNISDADENIDFYHIFLAFNTISKWFKNKTAQYNSVSSKFITPFLDKTKVIWYETNILQDAVEIFTRINMGKIPLTNAELIKALFLNSSNFKTKNDADEDDILLKQLEIASEWDFMEYALHNDEFWLFINQSENNDKETRIEFVFELIVGKPPKDDKDYIFREYYKKFNEYTEKKISDIWKEIKRHFQTIQDWFEDRELYHKIGYLVTFGVDISEIIKESFKRDKVSFIEYIDSKIKEQLSNVELYELVYESRHKDAIKKVLLLHNIQTMLNNEKENSRFPFNRYKRERWDIEHIQAIAEKSPKSEQHREDWLRQAKEFVEDDDIKAEIEKYTKEDDFDSLLNKILEYFSEKRRIEDENINDLSNLVLLDERTNRGYKNAIFPVKRKTIIEKEKAGTFVPLCTKNVFMKYYSPKVEQMTFWGESDRNEYFKDIERVINQYLTSQDS